jgi:hypothetical protein
VFVIQQGLLRENNIMGWVFQSARDTFDDHRERWDEINKRCGNHILLDSAFVSSLIRHFASSETLLGISEDGGKPGMVILEKVRLGFWQTFQPSQGPLGLILVGNDNGVQKQIATLMADIPGYCVGFSVTQQDPDFTAFGNLDHSPTTEYRDYAETSRIILAGDFGEFWKQTGRYFVDDLRRQTRRLEEKGIHMDFLAERDPGNVAECIRDYAKLEESGWKGREGTAVTAEGPQGLFYKELLEKFCSRGEGVIYRLSFNGSVVASDLCLERNGMTVVLKIAYDENLQGISPGKFIHREILKLLFEEGKTRALEWYGRIHEWQRRLGSSARTMFHVNFYRNAWVPVARRLIKETRTKLYRNGA